MPVYEPGDVPVSRPSAVIGVFRYDPTDENNRYELLPHIRCLQIDTPKEGGDPGSARFRYIFVDPSLSPDFPRRFEQVYPLDASGQTVVKTDDRLVVRAFRDDGYSEILFDGFVQMPQADLDAETETVSFTAIGTPIREWDNPIAGAVFRDADHPGAITSVIQTHHPARFNPDGKPNATPVDHDGGTDPALHPDFLGPVWPKNEINTFEIRMWTIGMAARYLIVRGNPTRRWVAYDDLSDLDDLLRAYEPVSTDGVMDVNDPSTYTKQSIECQDVDVTGQAWPDALARLIEPHGFAFRFVLSEDDSGDPAWSFKIYRFDRPKPAKTVSLQQAGYTFDPAQTNLQGVSLARDTSNIANRIIIDAAPTRVEASFVLAPLFTVNGGDVSNKTDYIQGDTSFETSNVNKYRVWGFDECGEGHWDFGIGATDDTPGDFKKVLTMGADTRPYVIRRRPGYGTCITLGDDGKPLKWQLHVSADYAGPEPGIWDGTGTWQFVKSGQVDLLDDRLGFRVTARDPNSWEIGTPDSGPTAFPGGKLCLVEQVATPETTAGGRPRFRLTCAVDADQNFGVSVGKRPSSTTSYQITRRVDGRDRYRKHVVSQWSANLVDPTDDVALIDDSPEAKAWANGLCRARESGVFGGSLTIPRLSTAYNVGDKISFIEGRGVSLRQNLGSASGESPVYPAVIAIVWHFDGSQTTTLELSDRRAEPPPKRGGRFGP